MQKLFKRAEGHMSRLQRGQGIDRRSLERRPIAPVRLRQADRLLAVDPLVPARRVKVRIGQAIVDRAESRRAAVGQIRHLDGGRFAGEDQKAVVGHVHRQIHQDVDLVLADGMRDLFIGQAQHVAPHVGMARQRSVIVSGMRTEA